MNRLLSNLACVTLVLLAVATLAIGQNSTPAPTGLPQISSTADPASAAEREQIWNSPTMLRARAWVQEYCDRSAKITPEEKEQYMTELENLSPTQMKLWLLKFNHEEDMIRQQQSDFNLARQAHLKSAASMNSQTQEDYANINRDENEAAEAEEQSIKATDQMANERSEQNMADKSVWGQGYGGYYDPFSGVGPGLGYGYSPHIHVHVHP